MATVLFKRLSTFIFFIYTFSFSFAQDDYPTDYLSKEFHAGRRAALREKMPDNSVVVIFAYPTRTFSNDIDYYYHANPDMYYFGGYKEAHSLLMIFKDEQTTD